VQADVVSSDRHEAEGGLRGRDQAEYFEEAVGDRNELEVAVCRQRDTASGAIPSAPNNT
jgi:hypothetical protein